MAYTTRLAWEDLRSLNTATDVTFGAGGYAALGLPLAHPSYILKMVNNSNVLVTVSIDGAEDIDVCPANSFWLYDEDEGNQEHVALPQNTQIYVKSGTGAAGVGLIYLVTQYRIQN